SVTITVTLTAPSSQPVTVDFATRDGTATEGHDYVGVSGSLTFQPNEISKVVLVEINDNLCCETNKTFTIALSNATNASIGSHLPSAVTILDDDTCP
ncbi:MAG: hypothetical protein NZM42_13570, partial [Gemmatales bacterium]|nr:hypothetical protein [Gemmatales bacterium]